MPLEWWVAVLLRSSLQVLCSSFTYNRLRKRESNRPSCEQKLAATQERFRGCAKGSPMIGHAINSVNKKRNPNKRTTKREKRSKLEKYSRNSKMYLIFLAPFISYSSIYFSSWLLLLLLLLAISPAVVPLRSSPLCAVCIMHVNQSS